MLKLTFQDFRLLWNESSRLERDAFVKAYIDEMETDNAYQSEQAILMIYRMASENSYRAVRMESGLSQFAFANMYGLTPAVIRRCEAGEINDRNKRMLVLLAYAVLMDTFNTEPQGL